MVFTGLLAGCGFHLPGALAPPEAMHNTYVEPVDRFSPFHRKLRLALKQAGINVVDAPGEGAATLAILVDDTDQRVLSVSARNTPTEYEVYYTVGYAITSGDSVLLSPQNVTLTRDYTYDTTLVLGKAHEEEMMRDAIVDDLVRIVMKQIATL